jgi:hypothetical protein
MKTELLKLRAEIQENYKADMDAINQLLANDEKRCVTSAKIAKLGDISHPSKRTDEIIEDLIKSQPGDFTTGDIYLRLREVLRKQPTLDQARQISPVINRLRQRNPSEIQEVEKGRGSRSGKYKYIKP